MKSKTIISILMLLPAICMYGQKKESIYEVGDSIVNCETNFENLINNWTTDNVTNANEYKLFRYAFVETITDSNIYNHYRNYLSGDEVLSASASGNSGEKNGLKFHQFFIRPGYVHSQFYNTKVMTENEKTILSDNDFKQKAKEIFTRDFNVDKMNLKYYSYESHKTDSTTRGVNKSSYSIVNSWASGNLASPDSISANYIDFIKKNAVQFDITEKKRLILEGLLIQRTMRQLEFNNKVHLGDKVYAVRFEYLGKLYTTNVICNSKTKKVIFDSFFSGINIEQPKFLVRTKKGI